MGSVAFNSIRFWARIMGLPDLLCNRPVAKAMTSKIEVLDVELGLNGVENESLFECASRPNWRVL